MDDQSRQVASELVEAGLEQLEEVDEPSWDSLGVAFLALGHGLSLAHLEAVTKGYRFLYGDTLEPPDDASFGEGFAMELHRHAAVVVTAGARVAVAAFQLIGKTEPEARDAVGWRLRSAVVEEIAPSESSTDLLMGFACSNYVVAAGELHQIISNAVGTSGIEHFAFGVLDEVVSFVVSAAAEVRATEDPAV